MTDEIKPEETKPEEITETIVEEAEKKEEKE